VVQRFTTDVKELGDIVRIGDGMYFSRAATNTEVRQTKTETDTMQPSHATDYSTSQS
jgi:hypothetical protein